MNGNLWRLAVALLPICFLSSQQPAQPGHPSPEALRHLAELRQHMRDHAIAINDLASNIKSLDDSRKLVSLVADEFFDGLPAKWATRSFRDRIARAEYESAADPGSLIPDQHVADAWDDFVKKIGAPQETILNAAEIHYLRDAQYVSARVFWVNYDKQIWTVPGIFALGPDGKVANGSRALESIRLLWLLANNMEDFSGVHAEAQKGTLLSDLVAHPEKPLAPGDKKGGVVSVREVSYPVQQAANRYARDHGNRALEHAIEDLLKDLLKG
jgi:hypothetical protein